MRVYFGEVKLTERDFWSLPLRLNAQVVLRLYCANYYIIIICGCPVQHMCKSAISSRRIYSHLNVQLTMRYLRRWISPFIVHDINRMVIIITIIIFADGQAQHTGGECILQGVNREAANKIDSPAIRWPSIWYSTVNKNWMIRIGITCMSHMPWKFETFAFDLCPSDPSLVADGPMERNTEINWCEASAIRWAK